MPIREIVVSVQKVKRKQGTLTLIGNPCGSVRRDGIKARCPDCRKEFQFSDVDVQGAWTRYDEWEKDNAYLSGIFDCPNSECERPFVFAIFGEKDASVGSVGFYERENNRTLKAKRE